jgi:hypothetical protein
MFDCYYYAVGGFLMDAKYLGFYLDFFQNWSAVLLISSYPFISF